MLWWTLGVFLSAASWVFGFVSTRYVDKAMDEGEPAHIATSNLHMFLGMGAVVLSLLMFMVGACMLALGIASVGR